MEYTQTLYWEFNENLQALELMEQYGNTSQYLDIIHDLTNIYHIMHAWSFDRDAAAKLVGTIYIKNYEFYKVIRNIPGMVEVPFVKAPDHILISNLSVQLCYLKDKLQKMTENKNADMLTQHTCTLLFNMIENTPYAS